MKTLFPEIFPFLVMEGNGQKIFQRGLLANTLDQKLFLYLNHFNISSSQSFRKVKALSEVLMPSNLFMLGKLSCKNLKLNTLKQSNSSTKIAFMTYGTDTEICNVIEIVDDNYLK